MEHLCDLLFEVSNEERLRILYQLRREAMTVTGLSKELDITTQESSRHLSRLSQVGLTRKNPEGHFLLTPYGNIVLRLLPGLEFISKHSDYFSSHSHENLPSSLVSKIGELGESVYIDDAVVSLYSIEKMIPKAEEYIWSINFPIPLSVFPLLREAFDRGVNVRLLAPEEYVVHPVVKGSLNDKDREAIYAARASKLLEERFVERMNVLLWMSEKEVALVAFPKPDGSFDSIGFASDDEQAYEWCEELFQHYWEKAVPQSPG
jgi:predicted transcriptional regulator